MKVVLKSAKKGRTKVHTMYTTVVIKCKKKERENKKLLSPSKRTQPINKINYGHRVFAYKQFGPS